MLDIVLALAAGMLTVAAPCVLPMLPIILGVSVGQRDPARPLFITLGFAATFALMAFLFGLFPTVLGLVAGHAARCRVDHADRVRRADDLAASAGTRHRAFRQRLCVGRRARYRRLGAARRAAARRQPRRGVGAVRGADARLDPDLDRVRAAARSRRNPACLLLDRRSHPDAADRLWRPVRVHPRAASRSLHPRRCNEVSASSSCWSRSRCSPSTTPSSPCGCRIIIPTSQYGSEHARSR